MAARSGAKVGPLSRTVLIGMVVVLAAGATGVLGLVALGDDDTDPAAAEQESTTTSTTEAVRLEELQGEARDLAELLAAGRTTTYHARYSGSSVGETAGTIRLESWAKGGRFRQDVAFAVGGVAVERRTFVLTDRGVTCQRSGAEPWVCNDVPRAQMQGADPLTGNTIAQLKEASVGEQPGKVGERDARCFTVTFDAQTTEMCVSDDGIPLQIRTTQSRLVVEELDESVADNVFTPPAASSGSATPAG